MLESIRHEVVGYSLRRYVVWVFYENGFVRLALHRRRDGREESEHACSINAGQTYIVTSEGRCV